jgi:hypothetical protein
MFVDETIVAPKGLIIFGAAAFQAVDPHNQICSIKSIGALL